MHDLPLLRGLPGGFSWGFLCFFVVLRSFVSWFFLGLHFLLKSLQQGSTSAGTSKQLGMRSRCMHHPLHRPALACGLPSDSEDDMPAKSGLTKTGTESELDALEKGLRRSPKKKM